MHEREVVLYEGGCVALPVGEGRDANFDRVEGDDVL